jgi:hypothetical protein
MSSVEVGRAELCTSAKQQERQMIDPESSPKSDRLANETARYSITDAIKNNQLMRDLEEERELDRPDECRCRKYVAITFATLAAIALQAQPADAQYRYRPSGGFGYPSGVYTPRLMMQPMRPSGGWGPALRNTPAPVYRAIGNGVRGIPTILLYPRRAY